MKAAKVGDRIRYVRRGSDFTSTGLVIQQSDLGAILVDSSAKILVMAEDADFGVEWVVRHSRGYEVTDRADDLVEVEKRLANAAAELIKAKRAVGTSGDWVFET